MASAWQRLGDDLATRYGRSAWRLPLLVVGTGLVVFGPLWLLRGMRLVQIGALALAGSLAAAAGFAHPFPTLAVGLFLAFSGLGLHLPNLMVAGLLALPAARAAYDALTGERLDFGSFGFRLALAALLAAAAGSLTMVVDLGHALDYVEVVVLGLLAYVAMVRYVDRMSRATVVVVAMAAGLGVGTMVVLRGLAAAGGAGLLALATEARFGGLRGDPNVQAAFANCALPLLLVVLVRARGWARRLGLVVLLLLLIATVVLSQSRAGMLLLPLILLALLLRERRARVFALVGIVALAAAALLLPRAYWVRFVSIGQLGGIVVDRSLQLRQHEFTGGLQLFLDHPWLGVGLGNFSEHSPRFMLGGFVAHNAFVEIAASLGIAGILAYLAWIGCGLAMARAASRRFRAAGRRGDRAFADGLVVAILAFCASALTLSIALYFVIWVLFGLAAALRRIALEAEA